MIELGLTRISRLLQQTSLTWKAIHIAGTNGKGSISAYVSYVLAVGGVRCGRFTSPHLLDRWDCITIDEEVVQESLFRKIEDEVKLRDKRLGIGASEFELLTATAFEIFNRERVEVGVVEVGLGGRLDATNILNNVLVSIISKIGLDHQPLLGNSIEKIAHEKAGILKPNVLCVVDGTNSADALQVLESRIQDVGIDAWFVTPPAIERQYPAMAQIFREHDLEPHQKANMSCAVSALRIAFGQIRPNFKIDPLFSHLPSVQWPGRLQRIVLEPLIARQEPVLLDGAHNAQSAEALGSYVNRKLRQRCDGVTWVIAASRGKDFSAIFGSIIQSGDNVAITTFGPVDGMPWVSAAAPIELSRCVQMIDGIGQVNLFDGNVAAALRWACGVSNGGPLVIAGSLYLVSDVLRLFHKTQETNSTSKV